MIEKSKEHFANRLIYWVIGFFVLLTAWFIMLMVQGDSSSHQGAQTWSAIYQIVAWLGVVCGLYFMSLWGGWKSLMGRANLAFTIGLLFQCFGQITFSYFFFKGIEAPYPSIADIGFFGSIPFYIYGIILLGKVAGSRLSITSFFGKFQAFVIPLGILILSYVIFLKDYVVDWSQPLVVLLDFGYPLGQAIYLSFAIVAFLLSRHFLGGVMKKPIIFFMIALAVQYLADYVFLFQVSRGTYTGGLEVDYLYLVAYFVMALSLVKLGSVFYKMNNS